MRISFLIALLTLSLASCGTYQKAYKAKDTSFKNEVADQYFLKGKYKKAENLYYQIYQAEKWKPELQATYYNYAKSLEASGKYELLVPFLTTYNAVYPNGTFYEETLLMVAEGKANLSEVYSKDQQLTYKAIEDINEYLILFPEGKYHDKAVALKNELEYKLEKKAFESAKLYNTIGEYTRDYNAAIVTLNNFILDYPGSSFKEDALYYRFDSAYKLAMNSVYAKMEERLNTAKTFYDQLLAFNSETKYKEKADEMEKRITKELKQFSKQ